MPKKKGKSKGKSKKGKKDKKSKKVESRLAIAEASARIWEARLDVSDKAKKEYRDNAKKLVSENDILQTQMVQTEKDTIDVITYLKKKDQEKDLLLEQVHHEMKEVKREHRKEKEMLIEDFSQQLNSMEEKLSEKGREVDLMHNELKLIKEFRRKRAQMQKDLDDIKEGMHTANKEHKDTLTKMEQRFFEEKMRLQQEASQKIAELAERAHSEAISNLDDTTKSVYKENVRVTEALNYHIKEGDILRKVKLRLEGEISELKGEKELNATMVLEKLALSNKQKETIKQLQEKVQTLEESLSHVVNEFEKERETILNKTRVENEAAKIEITKLQRMLELKSNEMKRVRLLARNILEQRTELERFFLDALAHVKNEINSNQSQYRHDAQAAYRQKMLQAHAGKGVYPKIRTFNKSLTSTNSVFTDLEAAEKLYDIYGKVDISELTWEQKERVLRFLFAKMNSARHGDTSPDSMPPLQAISQSQGPLSIQQADTIASMSSETFLTQSRVDVAMSGGINPHPVIPEIPFDTDIQA